jgi:hypothetical protein
VKWAFIRSFLRGSSFFGVVAIVIAISNAPIFQNVGLTPRSYERSFLVAYYIALTLALLMLFASKILFELNCPDLIKENGSFERYLAGFPSSSTLDDQIRSERTAAWRTDNIATRGRTATSLLLSAFIVLLPISFGLAALTLARFATAKAENPPTHQSDDTQALRAPVSAAKDAENQRPGQAGRSCNPPLCSTPIESCPPASRNPTGAPKESKRAKNESERRPICTSQFPAQRR